MPVLKPGTSEQMRGKTTLLKECCKLFVTLLVAAIFCAFVYGFFWYIHQWTHAG